ncbi:cell division FtsA domain-containing protein [Anaerosacchariphilus polymeriproducens]|uniref:Cell division protein FtsA n=1 Tax=Anaerosacchariphilus polymeriproducens TaxID=1812858 RepID=A0A371ATJ6_9FIRM|nr:cell division FtsA domain-containing protein [Anaerosacchariphilus polymeriproducens]RDU22894.1 cell division protein FtsA [Anaerosacchariphilus polymeriproducens]
MEEANKTEQFVFGLDIGTRNVVGTVGYMEDDLFHVAAQYTKEHDTRAMLDGQIHDITRVGKTIKLVKEQLELQIEHPLTEVCIAAAGRVLKTITTRVDMEFSEETVVTGEHIHSLDLLGVEKAQKELNAINDTKFKFYCVGYTVVKYFLNDDIISNLESHKAEKISEEIIVTFLPEDVVDGLYAAVGMAGLEVANLTLEPIAAINVAIPEAFRMLNIALVDVGAGTSDICITRDGSIIAYGMIPHAGDEITELIVQHYLVDFKMAEHIKLSSETEKTIKFTDIMALEHEISAEEVWDLTRKMVESIGVEVSNKIKELNGNKSVSAVFVVGGGGKIHGFTQCIAKEMGIADERVALRGEQVLQKVHFVQEEIKKDPLIVTPIGICLNSYENRNNFIFVYFNEERIKLYNNNKLTIFDAAMQAEFPNEYLFPRRGRELNFTVNGQARMIRGEQGESAIVKMNDRTVSMSTPIESNCKIQIQPSTIGKEAQLSIEQLPEYNNTISFIVNGKLVRCPLFASVNGELVSPYYYIQENDEVELLKYYTVKQLMEFMDVMIDESYSIYVNNKVADLDEKIYENFTVDWTMQKEFTFSSTFEREEPLAAQEENVDEIEMKQEKQESGNMELLHEEQTEGISLTVMVNDQPITMTGKNNYIYVDVFEYIDFDLNNSNGRTIVTLLNGQDTSYTEELKVGDKIDIYWKER